MGQSELLLRSCASRTGVIAASDPSKTIRREVIKRMRNIGIDISKKRCIVCVMDDKGKILEEVAYENTLADAKSLQAR